MAPCSRQSLQAMPFLDSQVLVSYTYMEAKWMPGKGDDLTREQFVYLLCTHLTLHFFCTGQPGPNYWDFIWAWGPSEESKLSVEERKTHPGAWALFADDWQNNVFGTLQTCFFRPENTWKNAIKSPGNAGTKGDVTAFHGYLHMNAYPVFLVPRLKTHSAEQEEKKDSGRISDIEMRGTFGKDIVPNFCFSTAKLVHGIQYTEGQDVCINAHNQVALHPNIYTEEQKVMPFSQHLNGIRWKILATGVVPATNQTATPFPARCSRPWPLPLA